MSKTLKIYISILLLLFGIIVLIEFSKEKPVNWKPTYNETHKGPFGTYVLYNELDDLFPESVIKKIHTTPFEYFENEDTYWYETDNKISGSFINISDYTRFDKASANAILNFVKEGNTAFVSAKNMPIQFKRELHFETDIKYNYKDSILLTLENSQFKKDSISIKKEINNTYFSSLSPENATVLGHQKFDSIPYVNFVKLKHKKGTVYLHLQPSVFSNYTLLKGDNCKYAASALSYLPDTTLHYNSPIKTNTELSQSKLRFILSQPSLRYAWYLGLISLLLFIIFNAKRKQRIVKEIAPNENTTVAFTKTIGNLYYETKDHKNLIDKKITYFLEHIRRVYLIDTQILDEKFEKTLAQKSGKDIKLIKQLINHIAHLRARTTCTETNLINLNNQIEDFYKA